MPLLAANAAFIPAGTRSFLYTKSYTKLKFDTVAKLRTPYRYVIPMDILMTLLDAPHLYVGTTLPCLSGPKVWTLGSGKILLSWRRTSLKPRVNQDGIFRARESHKVTCPVPSLLGGGVLIIWHVIVI